MPRNGRCSRSGTAIQSISRRTKSSGSLALIGPPKMTAPAWPSSVSGSGSPKRGRLMSSGYPSARSALPTRPGVEVSWCRTISTGNKGVLLKKQAGSCLMTPESCRRLVNEMIFKQIAGQASLRYARRSPHGGDGSALELQSADRRQDEAPWEKSEQEWHDLDAEARDHGALVGHQAAIA